MTSKNSQDLIYELKQQILVLENETLIAQNKASKITDNILRIINSLETPVKV